MVIAVAFFRQLALIDYEKEAEISLSSLLVEAIKSSNVPFLSHKFVNAHAL